MKKIISLIILSCTLSFSYSQKNITFTVSQPDVLQANAGQDVSIAIGDTIAIGGNPAVSGGVTPYNLVWSPLTFLSDPNVSNPLAFPTSTTKYTLTVTDENNCSSDASVTVTVNTSGISDQSKIADLGIIPNPNSGRFRIKLETKEQENYSIYVVNAIGEIIYEETDITVVKKLDKEIFIENLSLGIYTLIVQSNGGKVVNKIIVK